MKLLGWKQCDFIIVSGDAYIDHPSFGTAIIARVLEDSGYQVGIIPQPDWRDSRSITILGEPRHAFLVTAGNLDSMTAHYTADKKPRRDDAYTPGGKAGKRPDRALIVYTNLIKSAYKDATVILGGIEASLRRSAHYDYWSDKPRRSVLLDAKADFIVYGMAEKTIRLCAQALSAGNKDAITRIPGVVWRAGKKTPCENGIHLPSYENMCENRMTFAQARGLVFTHSREGNKPLVEDYGSSQVITNPAQDPLTTGELDKVYDLPFTRLAHPSYSTKHIPAFDEVRYSLTSHRGCAGSCSFCSIGYHQGRAIRKRSAGSLLKEARALLSDPDFKGIIHDVGGPTANFRNAGCKAGFKCSRRSCLVPGPCDNLIIDHSEYCRLLTSLRKTKGIKKVFIRSGIRHDFALLDKKSDFIDLLVQHHVSGQLKLAPEHTQKNVLQLMGKPDYSAYIEFRKLFKALAKKYNKKYYLLPYIMTSHPGALFEDDLAMTQTLRSEGFIPDQAQNFYPTPGTVSTCMFYTGYDPITLNKVKTTVNGKDRNLQRKLLHFHKPANKKYLLRALKEKGREQLIKQLGL